MHSMYVNEFAADKRKRAFIILYMCLHVVPVPQITHSIEMSHEAWRMGQEVCLCVRIYVFMYLPVGLVDVL